MATEAFSKDGKIYCSECNTELRFEYAPNFMTMRVQHGPNPEYVSHWFPTRYNGGDAEEHHLRYAEWRDAVHSRMAYSEM